MKKLILACAASVLLLTSAAAQEEESAYYLGYQCEQARNATEAAVCGKAAMEFSIHGRGYDASALDLAFIGTDHGDALSYYVAGKVLWQRFRERGPGPSLTFGVIEPFFYRSCEKGYRPACGAIHLLQYEECSAFLFGICEELGDSPKIKDSCHKDEDPESCYALYQFSRDYKVSLREKPEFYLEFACRHSDRFIAPGACRDYALFIRKDKPLDELDQDALNKYENSIAKACDIETLNHDSVAGSCSDREKLAEWMERRNAATRR